MLIRRVNEHVRTQNWFAVGIDFLIVVVGVVMGLQVSNWNEARAEQAATERTLELLIARIESYRIGADSFRTYYETTRVYGEAALTGWADETAMSDVEFLAAAYQASQISGSTDDSAINAQLIGAENVRNVRDADLQQRLRDFIASPVITRQNDVNTPYRQNVRRAMPFAIQDIIRAECGDFREGPRATLVLPPTCVIELPEDQAAEAAQDLRMRLDLRDDLRWHLASAETVLFDLESELERHRQLVEAVRTYLD
ncbi:MAG: hypothetical protein AAF830_07375 [Pseudomonadota bacterium]